LTVAGVVVRTGASIGVQVGAAGDTGADLLAKASSALAQAKRDGGRRWQSFDHTSDSHARERLILLTQLRASMTENQENFQTWFQPIVSLTTMETVGYEALIRWHTADRGIVPAGLWIEAAETDLALIHRIGLITARQSAAFVATLPAGQRVSINVSGAHLSSRDFPEFADVVLDSHRHAPGRFVLELTETTLASVQGPSRSRLHQLVDAGVGLWGDDFGTGYSSVAHLRDLPLTGLKLDKSFTAGLADPSTTAYQIADGLAGLAHGLGLETIAEGVETPQQSQRVAAAGWELGQGWLFGRPNPAQHWSSTPAVGGDPS
jgi:predicted signal transduction protein with EAL and GGDEF domain